MKIKNKVLNVLIKAVLFVIFTLFVFESFKRGLGMLAGIIVLIGAMYIFNKFDISHKKFLSVLIGISVIIRVIVAWQIHNPQMEFGLIYEICCHKIGLAKLFNVILSVFSILLMYRIMNRISDKKCAQIVTSLYSVFLNPIFYNCILSNQHIFLFLTLLAFDVLFEKKIIKNIFVRIGITTVILVISGLLILEVQIAPIALKSFVHKVGIFWNDFATELSLGYLSESGMNVFGRTVSFGYFSRFIFGFDYMIWEAVILFAIIGIFTLKNKKEKALYLIALITTFIVYLVIDIQGEQAFLFRPYVFILAAVGLKNLFYKIKEKELVSEIKKNKDKILKHPLLHIVILEILCIGLTCISLYLSTGVLGVRMYRSYFTNNWIIFLNFLPIFYIAMIIYVLTRKISVSFAISALISYTITLVNYFKMQLRTDTLLMEDVTLIKEALTIKTNYVFEFTPVIIAFIIIFIVITLALYVFIDKRKGKKNVITKKNIIVRITGVICLFILGVACLEKIYINPDYYLKTKNDKDGYFNIWSAVNQYISRGTMYSFLNSYKDVKKFVPEGYDKEEAEEKLNSYTYSNIDENKKVNVIGIMLEAYNDFSKFDEIDFNVDVYKKLHEIENESYSGELATSIFAGGTVDTERKFLTGYTNLQSFRKPTNSYARYFKEQGYEIEGSHPCYEWFYNRVNVNENFGFENYYFLENRYGALAGGGIAGDSTFMPEILKLYNNHKENSDKPYFSFNVTYQGHGPYPTEKLSDIEYVKKQEGYTEAEYNILNNYLKSVENTNENLYNLVQELKEDEEPVVLIVFGDHNPWLGNDNSVYNMLGIDLELDEEKGCYNYYCTPYFIWANDKAKEALGNDFQGKGEKISPNFLMNKFFELAGYEGNQYMKASNELMKDITVINNDFYIQNGEFTHALSNANAEKLNELYKIQYYWLNEYKQIEEKIIKT